MVTIAVFLFKIIRKSIWLALMILATLIAYTGDTLSIIGKIFGKIALGISRFAAVFNKSKGV